MQVWRLKFECGLGAGPRQMPVSGKHCTPGTSAMKDPAIRIAVLHFSHETITFLKNDTTLDDFVYPG